MEATRREVQWPFSGLWLPQASGNAMTNPRQCLVSLAFDAAVVFGFQAMSKEWRH